jgi:hypothetical protein
MPAPIQTDAPLAQLNNAQQSKAMAAITVCALLVVTFPGALIGAAIAFVLWRVTRPDIATRWLIAGLSAATAAAFQPAVTHAWSWPLLLSLTQDTPSSVSVDAVLSSLPAEALFGPLILLAFQLGLDYRRQTIHGQEWGRHRDVERRKKAMEHGWLGPRGAPANSWISSCRLAVTSFTPRSFDGFAARRANAVNSSPSTSAQLTLERSLTIQKRGLSSSRRPRPTRTETLTRRR